MAVYTTIDNPELYFQTKKFSGTGSELALTLDGDEDMQPDLAWVKKTSATGIHYLCDSVRGATKRLIPSSTDAETTQAQYVKSFDSDGITLGTDSDINASGGTGVAWCWKAGGSASTNEDGSTDTSVMNNSTAKFSIGTYTGTSSAATMGHGLGAAPGIIIIKNRSSGSRKWAVYHKNLSGDNKYLSLNENSAELTDTATWNNTAPTSTVFSSQASGEVNQGSENFVFYAFADVQGFSKFGSYTGNANADGAFVYTGFRPAYVIQKVTDTTSNWNVYDNKRNTSNPHDKLLYGDTSSAEVTHTSMDFLSNGFKLRSTDGALNGSGNNYIYAAFAEAPFVNSNGVPCNAR